MSSAVFGVLAVLAPWLWLALQVRNTGAEWQAPHFLDTRIDGVVFQSAVGVQQINVREELACPFKLAKINYEGVGVPTLGSFDIGDNSFLGARVLYDNSEWLVLLASWPCQLLVAVEKRQDYENPQQRIYAFQIYIKGDANEFLEQGILLTLENIFDNNPSITYSPSPCRVEELHADYLTDCIFSIYDPDGMDRNNIRILVNGQNNDVQNFEFNDFGPTTTYEKSFKLRIRNALHYEERAIYNLDVIVFDANNNAGNIFAILEVIDLPNRDPIWVRPLTTATFDEKQEQFFTLKAIDGDTGINKPICYRLEYEQDYSTLMSINSTTGVLHVAPIDRDALNQQIFNFYTCAFKCDNSSWVIKNMTILIVQDINDHVPEITLVPLMVQILEAKYLTLPLDIFSIEDLDLGNNATYSVSLATAGDIDYTNAFSLTPNSGYQKTNFSISVLQAESLDYEDVNWRSFEIMIIAQEIEDPSHITNSTLTIELINWNDEWPIFALEAYEISVLENVSSGAFLQQVYASDRDVNDTVIHSMVGDISGFAIEPATGVIRTAEDNAFDYERQTVIMLQIQAKDTLITAQSDNLHTTFAQLTINVIDVNDETPELRMPRAVVKITENAAPLTLVTDKIEARDVDTTANLTLVILWPLSYATKGGQEAAREHFVGCFVIEPQVANINLVYGLLRVNPAFQQELDYEKYDTIFLTVQVTDLNQEINEKSATAVLTIRVDDVNDNPPHFVSGTLLEPRKVVEEEELGTIIGTIEALDIDGPGNNIISYAIRPIGNLTTDGLIAINNSTGVLRVNESIKCDVPKIFNLQYEIILTDEVHVTTGSINISIIDINNRIPELDSFEQQVSIYENATTSHIVGQIKAHDDDRDAPHNVLEFTVNSAVSDIQNLFQINTTNGLIMVNLRNNFYLDRDKGVTYHYLQIDIKDNFNFNNPGYGPVNQRSTFINVTLLDVNDNAPIMPPKALFSPEFSEADLKDTVSNVKLSAEDKDEPNTINSWISYKILDIQPAKNNALDITNYNNIFGIVDDDKKYAELITLQDLKGFYGWWQVTIEASDHGEPAMSNFSTYDVYIRPHNFHAPIITYPKPNKSIRMCYALQEPNRPLYEADCVTRLAAFEANDADGGEYGDVTFHLSSDTGDDKYFTVVKETRNQSSLQLKQTISAGFYNLNVRATDGGGSSSSEMRNMKIVFVDMLGNPMFLQHTFHTNFTENEQGLLEECYIPAAYDPKNEGLDDTDEQYKLYYFIDDSIYQNDAQHFRLDSESRLLKLVKVLDRESVAMHKLRIKVTNNAKGIISNPNAINYTLDVMIAVNDVNDNPPKFDQHFYAAGITLKDSINKEILRLHANDPDLDDPTAYKINESSIATYGENIAPLKLNFFILNQETGALALNAYVTNNMKGYFMFNVNAFDTAEPPHKDAAAIKIYIVSEGNRVKFVFLSEMQAIRSNEKFIREELQEIYGYEICNIDAIEDVTNQQRLPAQRRANDDTAESDGVAFITDVMLHFINNNEAVDASEIQRRSSDLAFVSKLQNSLQRRNLILNDVPHLNKEDASTIVDDWLLTSLIVICILLAIICAILVVVFILKMRAMRRQLKAFEPPEFGSMASNLNRIGGTSTNIFSVEGSNPVINNQSRQLQQRGAYDESSSSDSEGEDEFDGLQDDPTFEMNNMNNFEPKPQNTFEHKILNNNFFEKEKNAAFNVVKEDNKRY